MSPIERGMSLVGKKDVQKRDTRQGSQMRETFNIFLSNPGIIGTGGGGMKAPKSSPYNGFFKILNLIRQRIEHFIF